MAKIEKGAVLTVADTRSGTGSKGNWCFFKAEGNKKLTIWAENHDFKCKVGDMVEILEIKSANIKTNKVGDKYYDNFSILALLRNTGASPTADFEGLTSDLDSDDSDFI